MENNILQFTGATYILFSSSNTFFIRSYFLLLFHIIFIAELAWLCNYITSTTAQCSSPNSHLNTSSTPNASYTPRVLDNVYIRFALYDVCTWMYYLNGIRTKERRNCCWTVKENNISTQLCCCCVEMKITYISSKPRYFVDLEWKLFLFMSVYGRNML